MRPTKEKKNPCPKNVQKVQQIIFSSILLKGNKITSKALNFFHLPTPI